MNGAQPNNQALQGSGGGVKTLALAQHSNPIQGQNEHKSLMCLMYQKYLFGKLQQINFV